MTVTALLVCHDGARWLSAVLDGLEAQTTPPDRVLAVDTGSSDATREVLLDRLGADRVVTVPADTSFPAAVAAGLDHLEEQPGESAREAGDRWLWLLHDDSRPAPDALAHLTAAAAADPTAAVLGPKIREWPSLRRLLEVGLTISGTGRRETGLERGEYDQGQHDRPREVLAVNTAGMLVRHGVLAGLGGFDENLPLFGNDIDLGWRVARAGHRTLVVPDALLFHAEAAHRGVRRTALTTASPRREERRAALYTLLVNCSTWAVPFVALRLLAGTVLRALGLLLVRAPRDAFDELAAVTSTFLRPDRIAVGRARRRRTGTVAQREVRHLLAPPWLPYRHGLDFLTDLGAATARHVGALSSSRRAHRSAPEATGETGPVPAQAQSLPADTGLLSRLLSSPTAMLFVLLTVLALLAARALVGSGVLSGGALLPAPDDAAGWWRLYLESWHPDSVGSSTPTAPYVLPLAAGASLLLGQPWLLVDLLFLLTVPLTALGGYRFLRTVTGARAPSLWGAAAYGLLPVLTGAVGQGRIGTVAAALVLPWLAHAALFLRPACPADRRRRAAWRSALWLALLTAFVPLAWVLAVLATVTALVLLVARGDPRSRRASVWAPVLVPAATTPVLLLPWWVSVLNDRVPAVLLAEAGLPAAGLLDGIGPWELLLGRPAEVAAAPAWLSAGIVLAAITAGLRADTRGRVIVAWAFAVLGLVTTAVLADRRFALSEGSESVLLWLGFPVLLTQAAAITAAAVAATGIGRSLAGSSFGWRQPVGLAVAAAAVATPVAGAFWWVAGTPHPLHRAPATVVPVYMADAARADVAHGTLVVTGDRRTGFEYVVHRGDGLRTGDDSVLASPAAQSGLTKAVSALATAPSPGAVAALSGHGIEYVYTPAPTDALLARNLDSAGGVSPASAVRPGARAWQLDPEPTQRALREPTGTSSRPFLLGLQALALLVVVVLAAPTRKVGR